MPVYIFCCRFWVLLLSLFVLAACTEHPAPGQVALINKTPVFFEEVKAQRNQIYSGLGTKTALPEDHILQQQYAHALREIIVQELICQYVAKKQKSPSQDFLDEQEALLRKDYPQGAFEAMLLTEGVSLDIWRAMLRRRLTVEAFVTQVLRPKITISSAEVQVYYQKNAADFTLPEQWLYIQIEGADEVEVKKARDSFMADKDSGRIQKEFRVIVRAIAMGKDRLPEDTLKELATLAPGASSKITKNNGQFTCLVLLEKQPPLVLDPAETYKRVEQVLTEDKLEELLKDWVEENLPKAKIQMAGQLTPKALEAGARAK